MNIFIHAKHIENVYFIRFTLDFMGIGSSPIKLLFF